MNTNYDLVIIGGGPAGVAAGVYAARKRLKTLLITESFGGQSIESSGIENWIGTKNITGPDFAKILEEHLRIYAGDSVEIKTGERVLQVEVELPLGSSTSKFLIKTQDDSYLARTVLITTGSTRKKLEIPGAKEFENKGITYCASCDGPLFAGQDVVVIGGGNAAFETVAQLLAYCKSVTLLHRSENFRADEITVEKVLRNPKMKAIKNLEILEIKGDKFVEGIVYKDKITNTETTLPVSGIFVEIGQIPNTDFVKDLVPLDEIGRVKLDAWSQKTSTPGIWAAGDCTNVLYHQNNIAAGDAVRALEDIYLYIHTK